MRKFSITDKLVVASIFISVITIIIVASFSFYRTKDAILERTFNQLTSVRVIKTNLIEKFFNTCIKEVKLAKSSSDIINLTQEINDTRNIFNYENKDDFKPKNNLFLKEVSEDYYNRIFIVSKNGNTFFIKNSEKGCDNSISDFKDLINKTTENSIFIKDYSKNDSCNYITLSSVILSKENEYEGIIVFEISSEPIDVVMLENNPSGGLGKSGESYLVGKDYLMRSSSRFQNESIMKTIVKNEAVESALKNKTGTIIIEDYRGVKVLSSFGKLNLPFFDWVILAEIDYREAVVPIYKIRSEIIFISIFIFIFILIAVIILSKMMTYPIEKLNNAAHEVSKGNLDIEIHSKLSDEIGELTESFNNMIKKLKHQSRIIEEEQKKSLVSLIDGQEIERQRLSRELHDGLGQSLIGLKLRYESCITKLRNSEDSKTGAEKLRELFDKTIDEIRRISNNLMPAALSEFGLLTAIQNVCNEISKTSNTVVKFSVYGKNRIRNKNTDIYIFRIIQEALTNIIKHSGASNAYVNFYFKENEVLIEIKDNGKGFNISKEKNIKGNGLANMRDRTAILSGKINIKSVISEGTVIEIKIPYQ